MNFAIAERRLAAAPRGSPYRLVAADAAEVVQTEAALLPEHRERSDGAGAPRLAAQRNAVGLHGDPLVCTAERLPPVSAHVHQLFSAARRETGINSGKRRDSAHLRQVRISEESRMTTTGSILRALRGSVSQAAAAEALNVSPSTYGLYERDEAEQGPPASFIRQACAHYHVSADYLLGLSDHPQGLRPGDCVVDVDAVEKYERDRVPPETDTDVVFAVPARYSILTAAEGKQLARRLRLVHKRG